MSIPFFGNTNSGVKNQNSQHEIEALFPKRRFAGEEQVTIYVLDHVKKIN